MADQSRADALRAEKLRRERDRRKGGDKGVLDVLGEQMLGKQAIPVIPSSEIEGDIFSKGLEDPNARFLQKQLRGARYGAQTLLTTDPQARADMLSQIVPGLQRGQDEAGNPVVRASDDAPWRYINKPGIDAQDATDLAGEVVKFAPAAKGATLGAGLLSRMGAGALFGGATSIAGDAIAGELGSEQGVDMQKAAFSAGGMGAGELFAPILTRMGGAVGRSLGMRADEGAAAAVEKIGLAEARKADEAIRRGIPLGRREAAGVQRLADDFGVPLSKGQATGDFGQIAFEESARKGGRGPGATRVMRDFSATQQDAVREAARGLGGKTASADLTDAGDIIRQGVIGRRDAAKSAINEAYSTAKGAGATIDVNAVPNFARAVIRNLPDEVTQPGVFSSQQTIKELYPKTAIILDDLAQTQQRLAQAKDVTGIDFRDFERLRSRITQAAADAKGRDKYALQQMRSGLDDWIEEAGINALASGDEAVIESFKNARQLRAQFGRLFEKGGSDDLAGRIVEDIVNKDMSAEQVVNTVFGAGDIGATKASLATTKRLKEILGPDSPEWQAMRDAAMFKVLRKGFGVSGQDYAPGALKTALDKALDGPGKEVMQELYTPEELLRMREFRAVVQRIIPPKDAVNPSGTADALQRALFDFANNVPGVGLANRLGAQMRAGAATRGVSPAPPDALLPRAGVTAAAIELSPPPR